MPECRAVITLALFEEASSQQGLLPTGQAVWKEVRGRMAAAAGGRKALADECPASCVGALLAMLLQQVRSTSEHEVCPYCHLLPTDITFLAISCTVAQLLSCTSVSADKGAQAHNLECHCHLSVAQECCPLFLLLQLLQNCMQALHDLPLVCECTV